MKKLLRWFCIGLWCCGCSDMIDPVDYALWFAGDNRSELEKVLEHYQDDSLKLKAARFLIGNMPAYFSYKGDNLDSLRKLEAIIEQKDCLPVAVLRKWKQFSYTSLEKVFDAQVITADYLIRNIDHSFRMWREKSWNKALSFEEFCELLLPYRISNEPLEDWKLMFYRQFNPILDSLYQGTDIVEAASRLCKYLNKRPFHYNEDLQIPHMGPHFLLNHRVGSCQESCDFCLYVLRAVGFPVAIDFYAWSPEYQGTHSWNVIKDTTGQYIPFWFVTDGIWRGANDGRKKGKVYRRCYGRQAEVTLEMQKDKFVPGLFKDNKLKDVTTDYFKSDSVVIVCENTIPGRYAYLGVFSARGWVPVAITKTEGKKAVFRNIEPEVIFQPFSITEKGKQPLGFAFQLTPEGKVKYFIPDTLHREKLTITRKYPLRRYMFEYICGIIEGRIEGAMHEDFRDAQLIWQVCDTPRYNFYTVYPASTGPYRYIRYRSAKNKKCEFAELWFYNARKSTRKLPLKVVKADRPRHGDERMGADKTIDGNILTYFWSAEPNTSVVYDLGKPQQIEKITYVPRNDDNFIRVGDMYELYYQNGREGWCLLEQQFARDSVLYFENVPQQALLWLRDRTAGQEERIFVMKNGKPVFCNELLREDWLYK